MLADVGSQEVNRRHEIIERLGCDGRQQVPGGEPGNPKVSSDKSGDYSIGVPMNGVHDGSMRYLLLSFAGEIKPAGKTSPANEPAQSPRQPTTPCPSKQRLPASHQPAKPSPENAAAAALNNQAEFRVFLRHS